MKKDTILDLTTDEFNQLVENFIDREDDRIEPKTFLQALAELERKQTVQEIFLTGHVVNGEILFDTPPPLPIVNNTFYVGNAKVTLRLQVVPGGTH